MLTGLDRLLRDPRDLKGRRYGLLSHAASVTADLRPIHLALAAAGFPPSLLLGPEHGFYGVEQDMIPARDGRDPWLGVPILSLYGNTPSSLRPRPEVFSKIDLLLVDFQDVGARYYTYAATAVWAAETALAQGCPVWVLDRPNPLGGEGVEGNLPQPGLESFVSAFQIPVRHGLTLGELVLLEARRRSWPEGLRVWALEGWRRSMTWAETGRPWVSPSPNMPGATTARVYPGACLIEATELSEGRGTTRPFELIGAPGVEPLAISRHLQALSLPGVTFLPTYFRPQYQKHQGELCGGIQLVVTDPGTFAPYRTGVVMLEAFVQTCGPAFAWRSAPYEFVSDHPAIDLLTGDPAVRQALDRGQSLDDWIASWARDEAAFREERREILLYPEGADLD